MLIRSLLGTAALLVATSCVPSPTHAPPPPAAAITSSEETLLHRLALATPQGDAPDAPPTLATPGKPLAAAPAPAFAPAFTGLTAAADDAARATDCLTAAVYYEARSEPADGQRAVAQVVLNRVRDRAFPGSVCGVVYQRSARGCQFSFVCDGSTRHPVDPAAWARARGIAAAAFGGAVYAGVGAATYYHTAAVAPWWAPSLARIGRIGAHIFYGWRSAMAQALTFRRGYAGIEPGAPSPVAQLPRDDGIVIGSVTIHRGEGILPEPPAATPKTLTPASLVTVAGVRIHRSGGTTVAMIADAVPAADDLPDADPI